MSLDWNSVNNDTPIFSLEGTYCKCKVVNVYDGDTCKVVFPLHDKMYRWNVRLTGYDTPEMRPSRSKENRDEEIKAAKIARDYLKNRSLNNDEVKKFKIGYIEKNPNFFEKLKTRL